jgi:hypothetical protein
MACGTPTEKLSELLDGDLSGREAATLRAHAEACAGCTAALAELSSLKEALAAERDNPPEPASDGWAELAAKLGPTGPAPKSRWRWIWAPTAALACALAILAVRSALKPKGPSDDQLIAQAETEFRRADAQYRDAIDKLRAVVRKSARPGAIVEAQAKLEAAVEDCRRVARERPSDVEAEQLLFAAYRKQIDFYEGQLLEARR